LQIKFFLQSGDQIINSSSMSGHRVPPTGGFYSPTKFAVRGISVALHSELRADGNPTEVATVYRCFVDIPLLDHHIREPEDQLNQTRSSMRIFKPWDIAASLLHFLSTPLHVELTDIQMRSVDQKA
jgi:NADP-dependent 3-hydroxy acid dehydrogenase YdfG